MLLLENSIMVQVKPTATPGWFEMCGPLEDGGGDVDLWLEESGWTLVEDAKVVGFHDRDDLLEDEPRLNGRVEGSIAVTEHGGEYKLIVDVNSFEAVLFRYAGLVGG